VPLSIKSNPLFDKVNGLFLTISLFVSFIDLFILGSKWIEVPAYYNLIKSITLVYSLLSLIMGVYIFLRVHDLKQKIFRGIFLGICFLFLLSSIRWLFAEDAHNLEVGGIAIFFSLFIAFVSFSTLLNRLGRTLHPSMVYVLSFLALIILGTSLLIVPSATTNGISLVDATFTITSGVTVTGLSVVDTEFAFTRFGKIVIMIFIQLGGLGVLTFSNLLALLFRKENSYHNRLMVGDMIKEINSNETFSTLGRIILLTIIIESIGALLIYFSILDNSKVVDKFFFAIFHSISAFCNAGFSLLSANLYDDTVKYNYFFQMVVVWLLVSGGIGYGLMINHYRFLRYWFFKILGKLGISKTIKYDLTKISVNNSLVLKTTLFLLVSGTILLYITESGNSTMTEHGPLGQIWVAIFNSATPRTAGFNNINMGALTMPSVLIITFLMWVGASPASTGGGIKTTTFAIAVMTLFNSIKGRKKLIYRWREIATETIQEANSIIILSVFVIGTASLTLTFFEKDFTYLDLLFETVSAYSTVGLSIGITAKLTSASKITLIITMFIGRVGFLTFLIGLFRQIFGEPKREVASYPKDNVYIG
jgi:trk system potassium uptake protein